MTTTDLLPLLQKSPTAPVYIVGAGITGCVLAERISSFFNRHVIVLEKRSVIGGNSHADIDPETGIEIHTHGPHIFHTTNEEVWKYIRKFTGFNNYQHKVLLNSRGHVYNMPINLKTINDYYGMQFSPKQAKDFMSFVTSDLAKIYQQPRNLEEKAVSRIGWRLYEVMIQGYTAKQWGRDPKELPESIINRLPVRYNYDDTYFSTPWQGIPDKGYDAMFKAILSNLQIEVRTGVDFLEIRETLPKDAVVLYTGMIDRLFDNCFGALEWRSLRFEQETVPVQDFQGTSVMNYGDVDVPYTRIHEFKHYHPEWKSAYECERTVICREYPQAWESGREAYYPVNDEANQKRLALYQNEVAKNPRLLVLGRLGCYQYCDMDAAIASVLNILPTSEP